MAGRQPILCMKVFMTDLTGTFSKTARLKTIKRILKKAGFRWKRMRNSLKGKRDEVLFRFFQHEIRCLQQQAERGEIDLCYFDETGFNLNPNVPYAWQSIGTTALLPAERGNGITVLGILNPLKNTFTGNLYSGAANSACVIQTLDVFARSIDKKTVLILDNATIHTARLVKERIGQWKQEGLYLQFIPAYCPELNRIETLWKMVKHYWIRPEYYSSLEKLTQEVINVLKAYGSQYSISFV
jgi:transposase